jgi:hypothetical protein
MDPQIIPKASYFKCESTHATFYTFDGNKLETICAEPNSILLKSRLDSKAPKPQPITFAITDCTNSQFDIITYSLGNRKTWIVFFDKNGFEIDRYPYDKSNHMITVYKEDGESNWEYYYNQSQPDPINPDFPLDLSALTLNHKN